MKASGGKSREKLQGPTEMETEGDRIKRVHDYLKQPTFEPGRQSGESPANSPAKKALRVETPETVSNNTLLEAINKIGETQSSFLEKLVSVESDVKEIKDQVSGINGRLDMAEEKISAITAENKMLRNRVNELESYQRRWNLKISGIPEQDEENVKMTVIELLSRISPTIADTLQNSVDVAHRLGPKKGIGSSQPRRIIVQFLARTTRDRIWIDAKNSEVLKQKNIKITEDLTQYVKDARAKLWPLVEDARRKKKIAGFKGPYAIIEGKRISIDDLI